MNHNFPSSSKKGWPWNVEMQPFPETMPDGSPWPRISIVTPSFNQVEYIEESLRSVLLQGYPNLEYIVMDGGSTDGSVEIIKKYEPWLTYWVSEKDNGQASAINKGFSLATGELAGWLNSDDIYFPGAFEMIAIWWVKNGRPDDLITGTKLKGNPNLDTLSRLPQQPITVDHLIERCIVEQPSTFFTLKGFREVGGLEERYYLSMDYDLWLRMTHKGASITYIDADFAVTRTYPNTKSALNQRRSCNESISSIWRNYRVISGTWLKKWITIQVVPQNIKSKTSRKFFYFVRNGLYAVSRMILKAFHLLHNYQE